MNSGMHASRPWGDWMVEMDEDRSHRIVRMTDAEWKEYAKKAIADNRGKGDLRPVLTWLDAMDAKRAEAKAKSAAPLVVRDTSPAAVSFRIWRDMILEPAKYGDSDWEDWLVMDQELRCGPGRWRIASFWMELEEEQEALLREAYATRIQSLWRGHAVRATQAGLSCEDCLARTPSPQRFNGKHLCGGCWEHLNLHWTPFVPRVVPVVPAPPPVPEADEDTGLVPCDGCGRVVCYEGDYGEYRPGYWCSRQCAYA